jgi:hypothetical protein
MAQGDGGKMRARVAAILGAVCLHLAACATPSVEPEIDLPSSAFQMFYGGADGGNLRASDLPAPTIVIQTPVGEFAPVEVLPSVKAASKPKLKPNPITASKPTTAPAPRIVSGLKENETRITTRLIDDVLVVEGVSGTGYTEAEIRSNLLPSQCQLEGKSLGTHAVKPVADGGFSFQATCL